MANLVINTKYGIWLGFVLSLSLNTNVLSQVVTDTLVMVWHDEFDGIELDQTKWKPCPEWKRQGGSYWEEDNHKLTGNGQLRLDVTQKGDSVLCGAVRTHSLYDQKFGYFEVRCKLPQIRGGWCSFWMLPYHNDPGEKGKDGTEIDVFESINGWRGKVNHALHWDGYGVEHRTASKKMKRQDLYDNEYHKFAVWWTPTEYVFYTDDVETWRTSAGDVSQVRQYLKLTLEVASGVWAGNWKYQKEKPIYWYIDYVRVYKSPVELSVDNYQSNIDTSEIVVYPNPTSGFLTVNIQNAKQPVDYEVLTMLGQTFARGQVNAYSNQIDLTSFPFKSFILKVGQQQFKIIKR